MKKLLSILLILSMFASLGVTAFAAETHEITSAAFPLYFDSDDMDVLYELISDKVDDLLKQASNKAGSIEAFLEKRNFREQIKNFVSSKSGRRPMIIFNISYVNGYSDDEYYGDV